jgi:hypothetical protein
LRFGFVMFCPIINVTLLVLLQEEQSV